MESETAKAPRTAVILFNLGGPANLQEVEPFLFNLFSDRAIIDLPSLIRIPLAKFLSKRRGPVAREIYGEIGGRSPILEETRKQQFALQTALDNRETQDGDKCETGVFVAMRYSNPRARTTAQVVKAFKPDRIVLLPLFPQFSTTTVGSALNEWKKVAADVGLDVLTTGPCCYPEHEKVIDAHAALIAEIWKKSPGLENCRILFSAHSLPQKIIDKGDPYPWQIENTVGALIARLKTGYGIDVDDLVVCYQSRVGPLKWLQPSTADEILRAGSDAVPVIVVPIAFVSEHLETLAELDIEYAKLAKESGVPIYLRVPALGDHPLFIEGLAEIVEAELGSADNVLTDRKERCPNSFQQCFRRQ